ncbi:MAG: translocation/assembly module TamB [Desulfuromonadales bacterium]
MLNQQILFFLHTFYLLLQPIDGADQWRGRFTFSGRNCQLLDRRAITLIADPELDLALDGSGGALSGKVFVPKALIEVEKIDRSASESSDVVFVDTQEPSTSWPFHYDIEVVLGDDVRVTGLGLNGKLGGHLTVASNPDGITVGRGYLDIVDGSFALYGSPLAINRGRLSFDGGPVDNPGLDIKASIWIQDTRFGYDGVEAGVNITGSADDFDMDLYSIPRMEESDILAYILLDKPISSEGTAGSEGLLNSAVEALGLSKGSALLSDVSSMLPVDDIRVEGSIDSQETTVVVGKKLSKDLSVSYDYNLFKNAGLFRVRYEFGKGFSVESRNSIESNAVELLYSLER